MAQSNKDKKVKNSKKIVGIVLIILFAFILFSLITGVIKPFSNVLFGIFGISCFCVAILGIVVGIMLTSDKSINLKIGYVINFIAMYFLIALLVHAITSAVFIDSSSGFADYINKCYDFTANGEASAITFGGVILGAIIYPIYSNLTALGTYFILSVCLIVSVIIAAKFFIKLNSDERSSLFVDRNVKKHRTKRVEEDSIDENIGDDEEVVIPIEESRENGDLSGADIDVDGDNTDKNDFRSAWAALYGDNVNNTKNEQSDELQKNDEVYTQKPIFDTAPVTYPNNNESQARYPSASEAAIKIRPNRAAVNPTPILNAEYYAHKNKNDEIVKRDVDYVTEEHVSTDSDVSNLPDDDVIMEIDTSGINNDLQSNTIKRSSEKQFLDVAPHVEIIDETDKEFTEFGTKIEQKQTPNGSRVYGDQSRIVSSVEDFKTMRSAEQTAKQQTVVVENVEPHVTYEEFLDNNFSKNVDDNSEIKQPSSTKNVVDKAYGGNTSTGETTDNANELIAYKPYVAPSINLLNDTKMQISVSQEERERNINMLEETLSQYRINAKVRNVVIGPTVTRYELELGTGEKVKQLQQLTNEIGLGLKKSDVIIVPHIPGKSFVGIEVSNEKPTTVPLRVIIDSPEFKNAKGDLCMAIGIDLAGEKDIEDLASMPHLLVAGSSGSGKSVVINAMIISMLFKYSPEELRFIFVDPKRVELKPYEGLPHLLMKNIIVEPDNAVTALNWLNEEMDRRYKIFDEKGVRDLADYNKRIDPKHEQKMYRIVLIVDEFADLMSDTYKKEVESSVNRLARLARAAGIHLILATQRPSVAVLSGDIKNNFSCRMALKVASAVDAKTILGTGGPEKLLGKGDMMLKTNSPEPLRLQGAFVSGTEISDIVMYIKNNNDAYFFDDIEKRIFTKKGVPENGALNCGVENQVDAEFLPTLKFCIERGEASISSIQARFRLGWPKACRIMQELEAQGYVAPASGTKARTVLMTMEQFKEKFGDNV